VTDLELIFGDDSVPVAFPSRRFFIGSDSTCEVRLPKGTVKPRHAEVAQGKDGGWWVRDLSGIGALKVNGVKRQKSRLAAGTVLALGQTTIHVRRMGELQDPSLAPTLFHKLEAKPKLLEPGDVIDNRYRIVARIAAGGMGEVYRAEHVELGKPFAVKVMHPGLSEVTEFIGRFKREAVAASRIGHQNIVDISDFGRTRDGSLYSVMEFLDGRTLASHLGEGPFPPARLIRVGTQIARALYAAHKAEIIHRDLKPENVMLLQQPGEPDFVKVLDFGAAKVSTPTPGGALTALGMVVGTPEYMSPEQAAGQVVDLRSDVYALGLILYEMLTGRPAFAGVTASVVMVMQMTAEPAPLPSSAPKPLTRLITQMLKKSPAERPQTMDAVISQLIRRVAG
jgi:eukaryotic-like serine/threonine-protein kinase